MADNPPESQSGPMPKLPSSGATGRLKSPTAQLPLKKGGTGKVIVMLSSVAKPPPAGTQQLPAATSPATPIAPRVTGPPAVPPPSPATPVAAPPKVQPISQRLQAPPPLPPKHVSPIGPVSPTLPSRLSTTTFVKLPPKTANPSLVTLTGKPATPVPAPGATPTPAPVAKPLASALPPAAPAKVTPAKPATPPPLPARKITQALSRKTGAHRIPPIKLNELSGEAPSAEESIFAAADTSAPTPKPAGWKELETGELPLPAGGLKNLDVFERSQKILDKATTLKPAPLIPPAGVATTSPMVTPARRPLPSPTPATPPSEAMDKAAPAPFVAPPLRPPSRVETKAETKTSGLNPPPLSPPPVKPPEPAPAPPVHVAPRMLEKAPEPVAAKLPQPNPPAEAPKSTPPPVVEPPPLQKVPALAQPEATPAKPLQPPATSLAKAATDWLKKTTPLRPFLLRTRPCSHSRCRSQAGPQTSRPSQARTAQGGRHPGASSHSRAAAARRRNERYREKSRRADFDREATRDAPCPSPQVARKGTRACDSSRKRKTCGNQTADRSA